MVRVYIVIGVTVAVTVTYAATKYSGVMLPGGEQGRSPLEKKKTASALA